jgi:hypothetical protein
LTTFAGSQVWGSFGPLEDIVPKVHRNSAIFYGQIKGNPGVFFQSRHLMFTGSPLPQKA